MHVNEDDENSNIIVQNKNDKANQQWELVYADQYPDQPVKGELNTDFGLYVERDFFIVSEMNSNRYLDFATASQLMIKTPNGRKSQVWYFDQRSLTIKTRYNN
jgi:hypothetical protein